MFLGRRLTGYHVAWRTTIERFDPYLPVLLDFGGDQAEFICSVHDSVSVTVNTVDPAVAPRESDSRWTKDAHEQLNHLRGQFLWAVDVLEHAVPDYVNGIGLAFSRTYLSISLRADWNHLRFGPPESKYRQHRIASMPPTTQLAFANSGGR